ncbi:MAG: alpha/beta hydrolase [Pseudomonadota bacterium]
MAFWSSFDAYAAPDNAAGATPAAGPTFQNLSPNRRIITTPDVITVSNGKRLQGERGLIFVPENRADPNSRLIVLHFQRYFAKESKAGRSPVFLFPGGPGGELRFEKPWSFEQLDHLRATRDVVVVSQRGFPKAPGLVPDLTVRIPPTRSLLQPADISVLSKTRRQEYKRALQFWRSIGIDVEGYDLINITDDLYELRAALGYEKVVLRSCSFGSQLSFSYIKRWPETVDRALLGGVEPLDYGYDSPKALMDSIARLAVQVDNDEDFAAFLPPGGLMEAIRSIYDRLEAEPVRVKVNIADKDVSLPIVLGVDDLRLGSLVVLRGLPGKTDTEDLALWPHFILDMYRGDFRTLGLLSIERRLSGESFPMMFQLIDNSIGISKVRDKKLLQQPERRFIDPNWGYRATRDVKAAPEITKSYRKDWQIDAPVLLLSGDLDWYTPVENGEHGASLLRNGKLIRVRNGTHCPLGRPEQISKNDPELAATIRSFIDEDLSDGRAQEFFDRLPTQVNLPTINFAHPDEVDLYELLLSQTD